MSRNIIGTILFTIGMCFIWCAALHSAAGIGVGICFGAAFAASWGLISKGRNKTDGRENSDEV